MMAGVGFAFFAFLAGWWFGARMRRRATVREAPRSERPPLPPAWTEEREEDA